MDLDAFTAVHAPQWRRLEQLVRRRRLSAVEVDELVALYQQAATHLSVVRSSAPDPAVAARLSRLVAAARAKVAGGGEPWSRELARFAAVSFPAAVYRARWAAAGSAAFSAAVALALGTWIARSPRAQAVIARQVDVRRLVRTDFAGYYTQHAAGSFAAQVWTNNAWVAALCIAFGITGILVVAVLVQNAANVGAIGGIMAAHGRLDLFFGLITPHGLLELTAVFVAAGAGLRLFWAWVDPGPLPRGQALAREGRSMVTVAVGLVVVFGVSGVVEAFVTPSGLPTWARIGVGAAVWLAFLGYVGTLGRRAVAAGETGDVRAELAGEEVPVAG
ncbi:MAG TPA: stage II sporulation protein M [Kineosporiaceae bacterium]|nr:stage II sporulation protein M [Kineosporiaceae bacterium]